jgi:uncharacterized repeat protein (TIGR03803 family)
MRITTALQIGSAICGLAAASPAIGRTDKFQTIYSFGSAPGDGELPSSSLIAKNGILYGTTPLGGQLNVGTIYSIDPGTGSEAVVNDGVGFEPVTPVISYEHNLYGSSSIGNLFRVDVKTKVLTNVYRFPYNNDDEPAIVGDLVAVGGKLFGTVLQADDLERDDPQYGSLFAYDLVAGTLTMLYTFTGGTDGADPQGLIFHQGLLYGVTTGGGIGGVGTIFSFDPVSGTQKTLHSFSDKTEGADPSRIAFYDGMIYGTASSGGVANRGTLFMFDPATGKFTTLLLFPGGAGGCGPVGQPVRLNGKLYGVTAACGNSHHNGALYAFSLKTGEEKVLHDFKAGVDLGSPRAGLLLYQGGLYGTTAYGGTYGMGTVFRYSP